MLTVKGWVRLVRISELARVTDTSVATLKFYLREGLMSPGLQTARNQADYDETHVHRVRLIHALTVIGRLSLESTKRVLGAAEDPALPLHEIFGAAHRALHPRALSAPDAELKQAQKEVDAYLRKLGWRVGRDAPARRDLAVTLLLLRELGWQVGTEAFEPYARAAESIARWEIAQMPGRDTPRDRAIENLVVGTVVFEVVLSALRRLAEEHHSAKRFGSRRRAL